MIRGLCIWLCFIAHMTDLKNNIVAIPINSRDREDISDSTTDFTFVLKKSLLNIASLSVAGVVIPKNDSLINGSNDTLTGAVLVDDSINLFSLSITRTDYTATSLASELQTQLNSNTDMLSFGITFVVSYSSTTNRISIVATYPLGATHTWGIQIDFTSLRDIVGIGVAGTTSQTFLASAASTTLTIPCQRSPSLFGPLSYNITSSKMTDVISTSYANSLGKLFDVTNSTKTLTINSTLTTLAHTAIAIAEPAAANSLPSQTGASISLSSTGLMMAVGSYKAGVYVFTRESTSAAWVQDSETPIRKTTSTDVNQGSFVSMSGDGTTIASTSDTSVDVYVRVSTRWEQQLSIAMLTNSLKGGVALSIDGSTLAIGNPTSSGGNVLVYTRSAGIWTLQQTITPGVVDNDFGSSISISNTGDHLVVGSLTHMPGEAYPYTRSGGVWSLDAALNPLATPDPIYGAVISGNGLYLALMDQLNDDVHIYFWSAGWGLQQTIAIASSSCSFNSAGDTLAIGNESGNGNIGTVTVYKRTGTVWAVQLAATSGTGNTGTSRQGFAVSLSLSGDALVIGGYRDNSFIGAVWAFARSGVTWAQDGAKIVATGGPLLREYGDAISISEDGLRMAVGSVDAVTTGAVFIYRLNTFDWTLEATIVPTDHLGSPSFGSSVSLSGDGSIVAIGGSGDNSGAGATWVFARAGTTWSKYAKIPGSGTITAQGRRVSLSYAGNLLAISGTQDAIRIFKTVNTVWTEQKAALGLGLWGGNQISEIDMNTAGSVIVASADSNGGAIAFAYVDDDWKASANFLTVHTPVTSTTAFGTSISISNTGLVVAIGDKDDGTSGSTSIFTTGAIGGAWTQQVALVGTGASVFDQGRAVSLTNSGATVIVGGGKTVSLIDVGAAWIFDNILGTWTQRGSLITGYATVFGSRTDAQKIGNVYLVSNYKTASTDTNQVVAFFPDGYVSPLVTSVSLSPRYYSIFDLVNALNALLTDVIETGSSFVVTFDGKTKLTISATISSPIVSMTFSVSSTSTFNVARWPSNSATSLPMNFSINDNVLKSIVNRASGGVIVDDSQSIPYRKYPAGYTLEANTPIDVQLRNDRDQIVDLNGADWIMTIYATVRS
jgi:hypothetical protein